MAGTESNKLFLNSLITCPKEAMKLGTLLRLYRGEKVFILMVVKLGQFQLERKKFSFLL
jgi:hypothetical protein